MRPFQFGVGGAHVRFHHLRITRHFRVTAFGQHGAALHIDTAETGNTVYDKLVVTVKNSAGTVLGTLASYSNVNKAAGYQIRTFDLIAYKGQTVQISFAATEDASLQTSFVLDKVSLITQ